MQATLLNNQEDRQTRQREAAAILIYGSGQNYGEQGNNTQTGGDPAPDRDPTDSKLASPSSMQNEQAKERSLARVLLVLVERMAARTQSSDQGERAAMRPDPAALPVHSVHLPATRYQDARTTGKSKTRGKKKEDCLIGVERSPHSAIALPSQKKNPPSLQESLSSSTSHPGGMYWTKATGWTGPA